MQINSSCYNFSFRSNLMYCFVVYSLNSLKFMFQDRANTEMKLLKELSEANEKNISFETKVYCALGIMVEFLKLMQGSHKLWKSWKTWKITKNSSMHGKVMEFEKTE